MFVNIAQKTLTAGEKKQVMELLAKDSRVQELYKTLKVRPLNELEKIILQQLVEEAINGTL